MVFSERIANFVEYAPPLIDVTTRLSMAEHNNNLAATLARAAAAAGAAAAAAAAAGAGNAHPASSVHATDWQRRMDRVGVSHQDLNRLVMNYLVVEGYKGAAELFLKESGERPTVDLEAVESRMRVSV